MNKMLFLKVVNSLLLVSFFIQFFTILMMAFKTSLGFVYEIHEINGYVFVSLAVIHVILNWSWIKSVLLKRKSSNKNA